MKQFRRHLHKMLKSLCRNAFTEDWIFLALLGTITAVICYFMDYLVTTCFSARVWYYKELENVHIAARYFIWVGMSVSFVLFSFTLVTLVAPQAIGSGIPEIKITLWGIKLKNHLSLKTGIAKVLALATALASGMPLGREAPYVHIASVVAAQLSKLIHSTNKVYGRKESKNEMLAAACAVGLAVNFATTFAGVLFSIEVTSSYFATYNYWRGFFSAVFASIINRLLVYWFKKQDTLTAAYQVKFQQELLYYPQELLIFLLIGVVGGLAGAGFILIHRKYSLFIKQNKMISSFLKLHPFFYPTVVSGVIASLYFPPVLGNYFISSLILRQQIHALFANFSWYQNGTTLGDSSLITPWVENAGGNIFLTLGIYIIGTYFTTVLAITLPVPHGSLVPIFNIGAAFGRLIGEGIQFWFPEGIFQEAWSVVPTGYAIVGAAAFSAGVTHSVSICLVVCEMTGHISYIIPVMIAVLASNAVSCLLQPSYFDSQILIKNLPYIPDIKGASTARDICVGDFMLKDVKYVWKGMSYFSLKNILAENPNIQVFPLVDDQTNMILLGSIPKPELLKLIKQQTSHEKRLQAFERMRRETRIKSYENFMKSIPTSSRPTENRVILELPSRRSSHHLSVCQHSSLIDEKAAQQALVHTSSCSTDDKEEKNQLGVYENEALEVPEVVIHSVTTSTNENTNHHPNCSVSFYIDPDNNHNDSKESADGSQPENINKMTELGEEKNKSARELERNEPHTDHESGHTKSKDGRKKFDKVSLNLPRSNSMGMIPTDYATTNEANTSTTSTNKHFLRRTKSKPILKRESISFDMPNLHQETTAPSLCRSETETSHESHSKSHHHHHHHFKDVFFEIPTSLLSKKRLSLIIGNSAEGRRKSSTNLEMTPEEVKTWEEEELSKPIDLSQCNVDPAPFQLVEQTPIVKVHMIFSLLGMTQAYVTTLGKLVGVVALKEFRKTIEDAKSGMFQSQENHQEHDNLSHEEGGNDNSTRFCFPCSRYCFGKSEKITEEKYTFHGRRISSIRMRPSLDMSNEVTGDVNHKEDIGKENNEIDEALPSSSSLSNIEQDSDSKDECNINKARSPADLYTNPP